MWALEPAAADTIPAVTSKTFSEELLFFFSQEA